jgi:hypothetical protein
MTEAIPQQDRTAFRSPVLSQHQRKGNLMSKLSRRILVASAASLPALAAPAIASALSDGDVELKQLGVRLLKENRSLDAIYANPEHSSREIDEAMERIAALMPPIFDKTATTRDGLAVQAAAAAIACRELWDDVGDWSTSEHPSWEVERPFIEAVCRHTGVAHPVVPSEPVSPPDRSAGPASPGTDPIFPAIERHRQAFVSQMGHCRVVTHAPLDHPEYKEFERTADRACAVTRDAAADLAQVRPTTVTGCLALLRYMHDFHVGAVELPDDPTKWHSDWENLPKIEAAGLFSKFDGRPLELPFAFHIMRNVHTQLQSYFYPDDAPAPVKGDDPVYAAIAATERARLGERDAYGIVSDAEHHFLETYGQLTPDSTTKALRDGWAAIVPELAHARLSTHAEISKLRGTFPKDLIGTLHHQLNLQTTEHDKVEKLQAAGDEASAAFDEALEILLSTKPTTREGLQAMLDYLRSHDHVLRVIADADTEYVDRLISTLASATSTMAA